jgi:hypothetical protein
MENLLDLYTDYLQVTFRMATATGMSEMLDGSVSHDKITRLLSSNDFTSKDLWSSVKSLVRQHETEEACLIFDDSIVEKPYTDENELVCWHFDHTKNRSVKGINLLSAFYHSRASNQDLPLRVPIGFEAIRKPVSVTKKDVRNKMPDFRMQTIGCEAIVVWHLISNFSRLLNKRKN